MDLSEWQAVLVQGEWFVGKRSKAGRELLSLQKLMMPFNIVRDENGLPRPHVTVLTYPWFCDTLIIPEGALWIAIDAFNNPKDWAKAIDTTDKLKTEQRAGAARAGLLLGRS